MVGLVLKVGRFSRKTNDLYNQGDKIGLIVAYWSFAFFGQFLEVSKNFGLLFSLVKVTY
jgi:hypothetical protein